ncbi:MAG: FoF1 ATP synthase subunit a [Candidatus Paceibacterota bacterium]
MDIIPQIHREIAPVGPETIAYIGGFPITNSFLLIILIGILFAIVGAYTVRRFSLVPNKLQNTIEVLYESMLNLTNQITSSRKLSERIFPLIGALFVYIGVANCIGLIPGVTSFTYNGIPLFRTPTSDFNTTFGLALAMMLLIQIESIRDYGVLGYIGRFIRIKELIVGFKKGIKDGALALVNFFIGFLDIIAEAAKVISLSFRLFGNMFAGEVLAILIIGALAYILPSLWLSLNLLFAVVQAIVFGALVAAYYTLSVKREEEGS